jgi:hypothetical protein
MSLEAWLSGTMAYLKSLEKWRVEYALAKLEKDNPAYGAKLRAAWEKQGK